MFNIRVYGILLQQDHVLLSDEIIFGKFYTKFPGGGLEFGEGTRDCIEREFLEEMNWRIECGDHFYTTDFFQPSAFSKKDQIISIYYYVHPLETKEIRFGNKPEFLNSENFRWHPLSQLKQEVLSLPIDKLVASMLLRSQ